jgi:hypothetical protein
VVDRPGLQHHLIVVAAAVLFELLRAMLKLPEGLWVFGLALLGAAAANWVIGRKINRKSLAKVRSDRIRERLMYRARHKFMSLPMENLFCDHRGSRCGGASRCISQMR